MKIYSEDFDFAYYEGQPEKVICVYFGYEVLIGELRTDYKRLSYVTIITLLLICGRGFIGV